MNEQQSPRSSGAFFWSFVKVAFLKMINSPQSFNASSSFLDVEVLKFGSSSLKSSEDVKRVAAFIRNRRRAGRKSIVVVSALFGETDRLLAEAHALAEVPCPSVLPRYVLAGEERSASALALALIATGISATNMSIAELELVATGDPLEAHPIEVRGALRERLSSFDVVVVPGFGGWCVDRRQAVLLGRGGSDLTAVHVAYALGLSEVTLIKDVDGVHSSDPKLNRQAKAIERLSWAEARVIAGKVVQRAAIDAAERLGIAIWVRSMSQGRGSRIGPRADVIYLPSECAA